MASLELWAHEAPPVQAWHTHEHVPEALAFTSSSGSCCLPPRGASPVLGFVCPLNPVTPKERGSAPVTQTCLPRFGGCCASLKYRKNRKALSVSVCVFVTASLARLSNSDSPPET